MKFACMIALAAAAVLGAPSAGAVNLSPNGLGQALIYPYYTVNAHQQTLLSVANTTAVGKVVKVRFREAYNGRAVLQFNLYLSPYDVWTATVFALSDASVDSDFAGIFTTDHSCTDPPLNTDGTIMDGIGYKRFANDHYIGASFDTGPIADTRTREGHIEMILMNDVTPNSDLAHHITHVNSVPPGCAFVENANGYAPPTLDPVTGAAGTLADGGLFGSASIVNVSDGVFYAYNADALDGFSYRSLYTLPIDSQPTLASVNDKTNADTATARVFVDGEMLSATYPSSTSGSRAIDAVSAVFAAGSIYNEYVSSADQSIGTDWLVTLPTKQFYVDTQPGGAIVGEASGFAPFGAPFGALNAGQACVFTSNSLEQFDREEDVVVQDYCGFSDCPPGGPDQTKFCLETNVLPFATDASSVLGSQTTPQYRIRPISGGGWLTVVLSERLQLYPASNGDIFHGLPLTGFAAIKYVNNTVSVPRIGSALANYSGAYHHRSTTVCTRGNAVCQ